MSISTPLRRKLRLGLGTRTSRRKSTKTTDRKFGQRPRPRVLLEHKIRVLTDTEGRYSHETEK